MRCTYVSPLNLGLVLPLDGLEGFFGLVSPTGFGGSFVGGLVGDGECEVEEAIFFVVHLEGEAIQDDTGRGREEVELELEWDLRNLDGPHLSMVGFWSSLRGR